MYRYKRSIWVLVCVTILLSAKGLHAEKFVLLSRQAAQIEDRCYRKASYFGQEQMDCGFAAEARQAELVNQAYAAAYVRAPVSKQTAFAAAQRKWKSVTDRSCRRAEVFSPAPIGTIATVNGLICLARSYEDRVAWLDRQYRGGKQSAQRQKRLHE